MAAGDTGAPAAGGAGQDDAPEPLRGLEAAGEQTASDHAPVAPGASEEQGASGAVEAGQDDAPEPEEEQEGAEGGQEEGVDATGEDVYEEEEEGDGEEDKEDAPRHLPFAPAEEESLDDTNTTTVDPSYTISLIRQLIPKGFNVEKEFSDKQSVNSDDGDSTQPDNTDPSEKRDKQGFPEERSVIPDDGKSTEPECKDQWEECGCILWDIAASKPQAELMFDNRVLEVLLVNLRAANSSRVKEICLRIMGNLACHESLIDAISLEKGLIATVVEQLFLDDTNCLSETFRLLAAILQTSASVSWAQALLPDEILSRILWIVENTENSTLLEKASADVKRTSLETQSVIANSNASSKGYDGIPEVLFNDKQVKSIQRATCQRSKRKNLRISKNIGSIGILLITMALLVLPSAEARPAGRISQPGICNHNLLAKQIRGVCRTDQPTPLCCEFIISAVDKGECVCAVMKDGVMVDTILIHYRSCGGLKPDIVGTIKNCSTPDVPSLYTPAPQVAVAIMPNKSKHVSFHWLLVLVVLVVFLGLMICVALKLKRKREASRIAHAAQGSELTSRRVKSPRKRQTADEIICRQQVDIPIRDDIPFVMTRGRAASLKEME